MARSSSARRSPPRQARSPVGRTGTAAFSVPTGKALSTTTAIVAHPDTRRRPGCGRSGRPLCLSGPVRRKRQGGWLRLRALRRSDRQARPRRLLPPDRVVRCQGLLQSAPKIDAIGPRGLLAVMAAEDPNEPCRTAGVAASGQVPATRGGCITAACTSPTPGWRGMPNGSPGIWRDTASPPGCGRHRCAAAVSHWLVLLALLRLGAVSVTLTWTISAEAARYPPGRHCHPPRTGHRPAAGGAPDRAWPRLAGGRSRTAALPSPAQAAQSLGRICFTSGTSGRPKPVLLDARLLSARLAAYRAAHPMNTRSVLWCGLGPDTAYGFTATLAAWLEGAAWCSRPARRGRLGLSRRAPRQSGRRLARRACRRCCGTAPPRRRRGSTAPRSWRAGALASRLRDALQDRICAEVLVAYGSSEAGGITLGRAEDLGSPPRQCRDGVSGCRDQHCRRRRQSPAAGCAGSPSGANRKHGFGLSA